MVEDIITTGLSSRECLAALAEHPGRIVGAACLIDRSGGKAEIGVPRVCAARRSTSPPIPRTPCRPNSPPCRR